MIPKIEAGETAAVFTPAWIIKNKKVYLRGVKRLEDLGFKVARWRFHKKIPSSESKIKEFNLLVKNPFIKMLLSERGGYGSIKLLKGIDYAAIKKSPKVIAGFSDLTAILNAVYERTGVVTFHSPMILNLADATKFTAKSFINAVTGFGEKNLFAGANVCVMKSGSAEGILKGGNLITIASLMGTPWEINFDNSILFLEDVDEKLYSVDRWLTNLIISGKMRKIKGLILGDFRGSKNEDVFRIVKESIGLNFPVVYTPNIGHVKNKITLPVGARVRLNTFKKELLLVE